MNPVFLILFAYIGLVIFTGALLIFVKKRQSSVELSGKLYQITVSKTNERGPLSCEQMLANLHGVGTESSGFFSKKIAQRFSFEVAYIAGQIYFYVWVPDVVRTQVLGQLYAQYPDIEVQHIPDYAHYFQNKVQAGQLQAYTTTVHLQKDGLYPIKKFKQFEDSQAKTIIDPLSGILSSFTHLDHPQDQMWVQYVMEPQPDSWHDRAVELIKGLDKDKFSFFGGAQLSVLKFQMDTPFLLKLIFFPVFLPLSFIGVFTKKGSISESEEGQDGTGEELKSDSVGNAMLGKASKLAYGTTIRVTYVSPAANKAAGIQKLREVAGSFKQFSLPSLNGFAMGSVESGMVGVTNFLKRHNDGVDILNTEELATIFHLPTTYVDIPNIAWVQSRKMEPPSNLPKSDKEEGLTILGKTNFRASRHTFGIRTEDRRRHMYIIGKTGMGKSTLLENMIYSDIQEGKGVAVIDPHGDLAQSVLSYIPNHRINDVVMFSPSDVNFPVGFNMLENVHPGQRSLVTSGLVGVFKKLYSDSWGPRLEHILRNTIMALLETKNPTMLGIMRMLVDDSFRKKVLSQVQDTVVKSFWEDEFEQMQPKFRTEAIAPIQNKVGQFLSNPVIRNIVGQPKSSINIREIMDEKKILIINLSKGLIGEDASALLGSMLITKFQLDAMSRADIPQNQRVDFYLYVDEFQNFATDSFETILSEARKYKLNLTMANQYIAQMPDTVKNAVFGNVGTMVSFQVGPEDAEFLEGQFGTPLTAADLVGMPQYSIYLKLLVDGMPTKTFSALTLPPPKNHPDEDHIEKIVRVVRERYSKNKSFVEEKIKEWAQPKKPKLKKKR